MRKLLTFIVIAVIIGFAAQSQAVSPLVDAAWVAEHAGKPGIVILDVRSNPQLYAQSHVPSAIFTHYRQDGWRVAKDDVPGMLPDTGHLEALIGGLGISNDDHVILVAQGVDATEMGIATRIYWTFKFLGHDEVSILDGGFIAYAESGTYPVDSGLGDKPEPTTFKASLRPNLLATEEDVKNALKSGDVTLIDHRPKDQSLGVNKSGVAKAFGAIPMSRNAPAVWMTAGTGGVFRSTAALKRLYEADSAKTTGKTINYCNTGHWASVGWFVSYELMGNKEAKLYDGSMAEWTSNPANPMERKLNLD